MKHHIFILVCIITFLTSSTLAQDTTCGTPTPTGVGGGLAKGAGYVNLNQLDTVCIPLALHILCYDDGSQAVDQSQFSTMVAMLNSAYARAKMKFFISSIDTIKSTSWASNGYGDSPSQDGLSSINNVSLAINIYFVPNAGFNGVSTFTPDIEEELSIPRSFQSIIIRNPVAATSTVPHEVGHYFNLFHTFETSFGTTCPDNSNGTTTGDLVYDTPPESPNPSKGAYNFDINCQYIGPTTGYCQGVLQDYNIGQLNSIIANNFMTYANFPCRTTFTAEQILRIRTTLENKRASLKLRWTQFTNVLNSGNAGGTFLLDGSTTIASGRFAGFSDSLLHQARTQNERFSNNKHQNWNGAAPQFR